MPIHELKRYRAICTECRRFIDYEAINRTLAPSGWTVTTGKTLADVRVTCPTCSEQERMEAEHE